MASRFSYLIKTFGLLDGIKIYCKFKFTSSGEFYSSRYKTALYLRPNTCDDYTFKQVFVEAQYDIELPIKPRTIIDAGANVGFSPVYFAHRFPEASIVAIEPNSANFESLKRNTSNYKNIQLHNKGLWYRDAQLYITNPNSPGQNDYIVAETDKDTKDSFPAISIGSIMKQNKWETLDLLKVDIEGAEREVFGFNYAEWLPKTKVIIIELHDNFKKGSSKAVFKAISDYHFSFSMNNENLIFINDELI